jgi:chemotaxis protein methyltransferase CheR
MLSQSRAIAPDEYQLIRDLVYKHSRIALGPSKQELVSGRVRKRLRHLRMETFSEYCHYLQSVEGLKELRNLIDAISTNYTNFFRDLHHFEYLKDEILQKLPLPGAHKFRIWSAACSSGEEPYSMAMVLADFFERLPRWTWEVEASDISTRMLDIAQAGVYEREQLRLPNAEWLRRFFQRGVNEFEGYCRIKGDLRGRVRFHHLNLFQPHYPFSTGFNVIFCRNVMIYFDRATQQQLVHRLADFLAPGGFLLIGPSESLIGTKHTLRYIKPSIYQRET